MWRRLIKVPDLILVLLLASMTILVFLNVILRYFFDTGIIWSEEMSRYLFVWLSILGAIIAFKDKLHYSVDLLIKSVPKPIAILLTLISNVLILIILWVIFEGSLKMTQGNINNTTPVVGLPLKYVYGSGLVFSVAMAILLIKNTISMFRKGEINTSAAGTEDK